MRCPDTLVRMTITKRQETASVGEGELKGKTCMLFFFYGRNLKVLWKAVWSTLKILKIEIPDDKGAPTLGMYVPKRNELSS
jgi:hypothetical protein